MAFWRKKRELRALQIEVTSRCTRKCTLCPRFALADRWQEGDLTDDLWARILTAFSRAEHIHLQGWGEPLLHPGLPMMVQAAKKSGASVGITTNGDLLDSASEWLLRTPVDLLTVSVAGNRESHARLRDGSALDRVAGSLRELATGLQKIKAKTKIQFSYLLTRDNACDLPSVVEKAADAMVNEIFVVHLDVTPTRELLDQAAFGPEKMEPDVIGYLRESGEIARRRRIGFRGPPRSPGDLLVCALNPVRFVFVGWDGRVGPCVNLLLPIEGPIPRWDHEGRHEVEPVCYGRLQDQDLTQILKGETRAAFVSPFPRRLEAESRFRFDIFSLHSADAMRELERADERREESLKAFPFPVECTGCHKQRGW